MGEISTRYGKKLFKILGDMLEFSETKRTDFRKIEEELNSMNVGMKREKSESLSRRRGKSSSEASTIDIRKLETPGPQVVRLKKDDRTKRKHNSGSQETSMGVKIEERVQDHKKSKKVVVDL